MKPEQQTKALAELDGWRQHPKYSEVMINKKDTREAHLQSDNLTRYLTSHDAIIPLRIKVCNTPALKVAWLNHARAIVARRIGKLVSDFDIASIKPDEDCEALLRATGKWTDDE